MDDESIQSQAVGENEKEQADQDQGDADSNEGRSGLRAWVERHAGKIKDLLRRARSLKEKPEPVLQEIVDFDAVPEVEKDDIYYMEREEAEGVKTEREFGSVNPGDTVAEDANIQPSDAGIDAPKFDNLEETRSVEIYNSSEVRDLFHDGTLAEFSDKLKKSNGKAFFIVHPFYLAGNNYDGYVGDAMRGDFGKDDGQKKFWHELATIAPKLKEQKVPIVFMQEIPYLGENTLEDTDKIQGEFDALQERLNTIIDANSGPEDRLQPEDFFVVYTERGGPHPIRSKAEKEMPTSDYLSGKMQKLKDAGLKVGIVGGSYVKPSEGDDFELYPRADDRYEKDWPTIRKKHESIYGKWNLKDYYDEKRKGDPSHPLQVVRLDHCAGEVMRMLAKADIQPGISSVTYPDKIDVASSYVPVKWRDDTFYQRLPGSRKERWESK